MRPSVDNLIHLVDIFVVGLLIYFMLQLVRSTRAWRIFVGITIFVVVLFLSEFLQLRTLHWLLEKATLLGPVALVILFLPELRQALEGFAKFGLITDGTLARSDLTTAVAEEVVSAAAEMSSLRVGALIVFERGNKLDDIVGTGVPIGGNVTSALLNAIFYGANPLHDGAVVIRGNRVMAAACRLPLSESRVVEKEYHMRHRAAIGLSEQCDAFVVVVSEERGSISIAENGRLEKLADHLALRTRLHQLLKLATSSPRHAEPQTEPLVEAVDRDEELAP